MGFPRMSVASDDPLESRIKAAFIFNFIRFTQWPADSFASPGDPLVIGVVASDAMVAEIQEAMKDKRVNDRPLQVQRFTADNVGRCHVLFVAAAGGRAADILKTGGSARLTIGDGDDFTDAGGVVRFFVEDGKERFEINVAAAERAHLQISGKLLKLARTISK